jgi:hypothetical protein
VKRYLSTLACALPLLVFLTGCATHQFVRLPDLSSTLKDQGKCRIYVVKSYGHFGGCTVYDGKTCVGEIGFGGYLCWERGAGKAVVSSHMPGAFTWEDGTPVTFFAATGQTYYIVWDRGRLLPASEADGQQYLRQYLPPKVTAQ